jgi:peptide-methionine (S)-S-oxide reductase
MKNQATFAMGCFWQPDKLFSDLIGVIKTTVGYTGGKMPNPTYEQVCSGKTGHAEAVEIEYDPEKISYTELLDIFWKNHNPTSLNRQGPDVGEQYRSAIFYHDEEQKAAAEASVKELKDSGKFDRPIVTQIIQATTFYPAEEYHQKYLLKRGLESCSI